MSESRTQDAGEAVALIRKAMEKITHLAETPEQRVSADGIVVVLGGTIGRIEALADDEGE